MMLGALTAEFEREFLSRSRRGLREDLADLGRAGEREFLHIRVFSKKAGRLRPRP